MNSKYAASSNIVLGLLFLSAITLDQSTKWYFTEFGSLNFSANIVHLHRNYGMILGSLSQASTMARIVFTSVLYGFVMGVACLLIYLLPGELRLLKGGVVLFGSSVSGNFIDKIRLGYTVDFINVLNKFYMNFSDIFMTLSAAVIVIQLFRHNHFIWYQDSKRKNILTDYGFQINFSVKVALLSFFNLLILGMFAVSFIKHETGVNSALFIGYGVVILILLMAIDFIISLFISREISGSLIAIERLIDDLQSGKECKPTFRKSDLQRVRVIQNKIIDLMS